jgi:hypothetical protein
MTPAKRSCWAVCLLALSLVSACLIIPIRKGAIGPGGKAKSVDRGFLKAGVTTRKEVEARLHAFDTGIPDDSLFWGRFETQWDVYWAIVGGGIQGPASAAGDKATTYLRGNVLIEFDSSGVYLAHKSMRDEDLIRELARSIRRLHPRDGPDRMDLSFPKTPDGSIAVQNRMFLCCDDQWDKPRFACELNRLTSLKVMRGSNDIWLSVRLLAVHPRGLHTKVERHFKLTADQLFALVRTLNANGFGDVLINPK